MSRMNAMHSASKGFFVTGTDTGVGKTVISAVLCLALNAAYFKPVQTGAGLDDDLDSVLRLAGLSANRLFAPLVKLAAPLAPSQAAELEGASPDWPALGLPKTDRPLIVEGAGGALVPMAEGLDMAGLMARFGLPVIVVARSGLGTINHTLLTLEALRARGLNVAGVVLVGPEEPLNRRDIERLGQVRMLFSLPWMQPISAQALRDFAAGLDLSRLADEPSPAVDLASLDRRHVWHPFTQAQTADPAIPAVRAQGARLFTADGRSYLDLISSWWVTLHGHAHPDVAQAVARQARTLEQVIFADFTHEPAVRLSESLCNLLPGDLSRVFFTDNGSTAVEVALKMAHQFWRNQGHEGRDRFAAFQGGYHGDTVGAMSVGFSSGYYQGFERLTFQVDFLPYPATWLNDHEVEAKETQALAAMAEYLERFGSSLAGVLIEPLIQGASGMRMVRPGFLKSLAELCAKAGTLLIFDEVMTGFGRTGAMFACLKAGVNPDIVCLSKGLTAGFMPMAATVATGRIYEGFLGETFDRALAHGHSFTANPLGCAAGLASLEVFARENTLAKIEALRQVHEARLTALASHPKLAKPRFMGPIGAVELAGLEPSYAAGAGKKLKRYFMDKGLYVRPMGNVFYLLPPYCLTPQELHLAYDTLEKALTDLT